MANMFVEIMDPNDSWLIDIVIPGIDSYTITTNLNKSTKNICSI